MKKIHKNSTDIHQRQGQELSKKLYRIVSEQAKRLDDARSCIRTINDLFTPNLQVQRRKFCDYCEKLILTESVVYGKKGEELIWRRGYYDVVSTAKKLKKKDYTPNEISNLLTHINAGIGFYHHLISRLQNDLDLNLGDCVDFPMILNGNRREHSKDILAWAEMCIHHSLIYLGDLNRYKSEILNEIDSLAFRYYLQAILYKPDYGMPHNQMGTLTMNQNRFVDAVYHYMRCLSCRHPFEGTLNNLQSLFEKNSKSFEQLTDNQDQKKRLEIRFLHLIDTWYFDKKSNKIYQLCQQIYKDLDECLTQLNDEFIFKLVTITLLCISKLQDTESPQLSTAVAFALAIYSLLIQNVANHIQEAFTHLPATETKCLNGILRELFKKKKTLKLRRRKPLKNESESEASEDEICSDGSSDESFMSDLENALSNESSDEEALTTEKSNGTSDNDVYKKIQQTDVNALFDVIMKEKLLCSIKIFNDWLVYNPEILKSCSVSTPSLLNQITNLLNLLNINANYENLSLITKKINIILKNYKSLPLSEDVVLKGVQLLSKSHAALDWNYMNYHEIMNDKEEMIVRIMKLMSYGKFLTNLDGMGIEFNDVKNILFVCKRIENEEMMMADGMGMMAVQEDGAIVENNKTMPVVVTDESKSHGVEEKLVTTPTTLIGSNRLNDEKETSESKGQLMKMKHMGQLWLAAEVRALETRVRGKASLSPYLVLDTDALIKYTFMVKQLVNSRKFIVLIPSAVVSALDDLKREQSEARDAIRWLETQFHKGNRFFRAQRPQERTPIPFIKYPKKKDKEMSTYIQIIECCHFLSEQQKDATDLVTLLIGNSNVLSNGENKEFSYVGLAQSAGIAIESITQFYKKWKKNFKEKR